MLLIDRYIIREWIKIFVIMLVSTIGILLMEDAYKNLHHFLVHGARGVDLILYHGVLCISFVPIVITLSLFLSLLYVLGNFNRNNEITAMRASGISLIRISIPLLVMAGLCSAVLFYLNSSWVPWAAEKARQLHFKMEAQDTTCHAIPNLTYDNFRENRLWIINSFHPVKSAGVSVYQLNNDRKEIERIVAQSAFYKEGRGWIFLKGRVITLDEKTGEIVRSQYFDEFEKPFAEDPAILWLLQQRPRNLTLTEIKQLVDDKININIKNLCEFEVRYYEIILLPIGCFVIGLLAIPFAVSGLRVNPLTGLSKSLSWFFVYYLINNIGTLIASQGTISPLLAVLTPNILILAVAVWLYRKAAIL